MESITMMKGLPNEVVSWIHDARNQTDGFLQLNRSGSPAEVVDSTKTPHPGRSVGDAV